MPGGTPWVVVLLLVFAAEVNADTILQVSGPVDYTVAGGDPDQFGNYSFMVVSWNQANAYDSVNISFSGNGMFSTATGTAYLTTLMGPGTTVADEIASAAFSAPVDPLSPISLFSGLNLPAGSYYLMIFADPGSQFAWDATNSPTTTLGTGVTPNFAAADAEYLIGGMPYAPYPPASGYVIGFQDDLLVDVTSTPEPSALSMLAAYVLVGLIFGRRAWSQRVMGRSVL
jgi:hypothetical protein